MFVESTRLDTIIKKNERDVVKIIVNGKEMEFEEEVSLLDVLKKLSLETKVMAAAVNMEIVKQNMWSDYKLKNSDKLELLDFVGGG